MSNSLVSVFVMIAVYTCCFVLCAQGRSIVDNIETVLTRTLLVAKCRANCLKEFSNENTLEKVPRCTNKINSKCDMCWFFCEELLHHHVSNVEKICADQICFTGCKKACAFYNNQRSSSTPLFTVGQSKIHNLKINDRIISWDRPDTKTLNNEAIDLIEDEAITYVVLGRILYNDWVIQTQTADLTSSITPGAQSKMKAITVIGVSEKGFIILTDDPRQEDTKGTNSMAHAIENLTQNPYNFVGIDSSNRKKLKE